MANPSSTKNVIRVKKYTKQNVPLYGNVVSIVIGVNKKPFGNNYAPLCEMFTTHLSSDYHLVLR